MICLGDLHRKSLLGFTLEDMSQADFLVRWLNSALSGTSGGDLSLERYHWDSEGNTMDFTWVLATSILSPHEVSEDVQQFANQFKGGLIFINCNSLRPLHAFAIFHCR